MNFTPFGNPFPSTIPGIQQFTTTTAPLISTVATAATTINQDTAANRYHSSTVNMTHFNQPLPMTTLTATPSKFRHVVEEAAHADKYNGHLVASIGGNSGSGSSGGTNQPQQQQQQQYTSIPYSQQSTQVDDKRIVAASIAYPQNTIAATTVSAASTVGVGHIQQAQPQGEISQELCNALLQQQTTVDTKKGIFF